jgi:tyrosyl-tRNA synthetase
MTLIKELKARGLVHQVTHEKELEDKLNNESLTLYCGFDPTAESLHVGSLLPLVTLLRFQKAGHNIIPLVGGATGMIGDPSGKSEERTLNTLDTIESFKQGIMTQIESIIEVPCTDNLSWISQIDMITFLRDFGKHFSVNAMLGKESVRQRVDRDDQGISFTEFSYMLIQSMDFLKLHQNQGCQLQIGGSDQWGNITAGTDLIRKTMGSEAEAFGLTIPLITNSEGKKFGKTESGAVWLDPAKTSPFQFFQFWLKTTDNDVYKFLRFFSMKSVEEIAEIEETDKNSGTKPIAQKLLAEELTAIVHGQESLESVLRITDALFSSDFEKLSLEDFEQLKMDGMSFSEIENDQELAEVVLLTGLASSKRQSREFIRNGAIQFNGQKEVKTEFVLNNDMMFFGKFGVLKRGKRNFALIEVL